MPPIERRAVNYIAIISLVVALAGNIGALIWGAAKLDASVTQLKEAVNELKEGNKEFRTALLTTNGDIRELKVRVSSLERK